MTKEELVTHMADYIKSHDTPDLIELVIKAINKVNAKENEDDNTKDK